MYFFSSLHVKSSNISCHDFLDQSNSCLFFLRLSRRSADYVGDLHAVHIDAIVELFDDHSELAKQKFDKRIGKGVFLLHEVVFDPAKTLAYSDHIVWTIFWGVVLGVKNSLHLGLDLVASGKLVKCEEILLQVEIEIAF